MNIYVAYSAESCNGWRCLLLVVYLEGDGNDGDATQLFYQDCNEQPDFCPLDVTITLKVQQTQATRFGLVVTG